MKERRFSKIHISYTVFIFGLYILIIFCMNWKLLLGMDLMKWDIMDAHLPSSLFMSNCFQHGKIPMWNPLYDFGVPHYASIGMPTYYLTTILCEKLGYSVWMVGFEYCIHILFACFGMFLLVKYFLNNERPMVFPVVEFVIGLIYGFSTIFISNAEHIMIIISAAWMPYVFLYIRKYLDSNKVKFILFAAVFSGFSIQGGYPELWVAMFITLIPFFLVYEKETRIPYKILFSAFKYCLFFGLTLCAGASILVPFINVIPRLERMGGNVQVNSYSIQYVWSMIVPGFYNYAKTIPNVIDCSMISMYMGLITVVSLPAILIRKHHKESLFFLGVSVFAFLMMLGNNSFLHPIFYKYFPGFSTLRFPSLWRCIMAIFMLLLVAVVWEEVWKKNKKTVQVICIGGSVEAVILLVAAVFLKRDNGSLFSDHEKMGNAIIGSVVILGIYILLSYLIYIFDNIKIIRTLKLLFVLFVVLDVFLFYSHEREITVYMGRGFSYFEDTDFQNLVKYNYDHYNTKYLNIDYSKSGRVVGGREGTRTVDVVLGGKLSEWSYTPLHFKNTVAYRNSYNEKITRGNPISYLTDNIATANDTSLQNWLNDPSVPSNQIYIENPLADINTSGNLYWEGEIIEKNVYNKNVIDNIAHFFGKYSDVGDDSKYRKIRFNIEKNNKSNIGKLEVKFVGNDVENIVEADFNILEDNIGFYIELNFPSDDEYNDIQVLSADIEISNLDFLICEKTQQTDTVVVDYFYPNNISVSTNADQAGYLVLLQNKYPGWRVYIDGTEKEIELVNGAFMGVYIESGNHRVVFKFRPIDFFAGIGLSVIYYLFVFTIMILSKWRSIRNEMQAERIERSRS